MTTFLSPVPLITLCAAVQLTLGTGAFNDERINFDLTTELQRIANQLARKYDCCISMAVRLGDSTLSVASGSNVTGSACSTEDTLVWGSVTKVHTGSAVLRLISEGKLQLDAPILPLINPIIRNLNERDFSSLEDLFGPEVCNVTVRDLLGMTSGIPDFDTADWDGPTGPIDPLRATIYKQPQVDFAPQALLSMPWVHTHNLSFTPGSCPLDFCYSSTNFLLLGMLLAHQQHPSSTAVWRDYNQKNVFPADLVDGFKALKFATTGNPSEYTRVHGYDHTWFNHPKAPFDVFNVSGVFAGWTASNVVGPAGDMARFTYDVYAPTNSTNTSRIIPNSTLLSLMYSSANATGYGLATFNLSKYTGVKGPGGIAYGHLGATYGYQSLVAFSPVYNFSIAIASNIETNRQSQPADAFCSAFNTIKAALEGRQSPPNCTFTTQGYYQKSCKCTNAASVGSTVEAKGSGRRINGSADQMRRTVPPAGSHPSAPKGVSKRTLDLFDTNTGMLITRTYYIAAPDVERPDAPYSLVLNLHGYYLFDGHNGTDAAQDEMHIDHMPDIAAEYGNWLVVYPLGSGGELEGIGNTYSWNVRGNMHTGATATGGEICYTPRGKQDQYQCYRSCRSQCDPVNGCSFASCQDDRSFLRQLLYELKSLYRIDNDRVHMLGFSTGGMMCFEFASSYPEEIASIVLAEANQFALFPLIPNSAVSLLDVHGYNDHTMPANASEARGTRSDGSLISSDRFYYSPLKQTLKHWATHTSCTGDVQSFDPGLGTLPEAARFGCRLPFGTCSNVIIAACSGNWTHRWPLYDFNTSLYSRLAFTFFQRTTKVSRGPVPTAPQTDVQAEVLHKVRTAAVKMEQRALNRTMHLLGSSILKERLRELHSQLVGVSASDLYTAWNTNWETVEMVHGAALVDSDSRNLDDWSAILRPEAHSAGVWYNQWALPYINATLGTWQDAQFNYYSAEAIAETQYFKFPPFSVPRRGFIGGTPGSFSEAIDRPVYTAANLYRLSFPTAHWGAVGLVLNSSFSNRRAVVVPADSGLYTVTCNPAFVQNVCHLWNMSQNICNRVYGCSWNGTCTLGNVAPARYNCSGWQGDVGTHDATGHLIESFVTLPGWNDSYSRLALLLARALVPWSNAGAKMKATSDTSFQMLFEANIAGILHLPRTVKLILADFGQLFGTQTGSLLRQWAFKHRLPLAWASSGTVNSTLNDGRILDPTLISSTMLNSSALNLTGAKLTYDLWWTKAQQSRAHQAAKWNSTTVLKWFEGLRQMLPDGLSIEPLFVGSCMEPHRCIGVEEANKDCVCKSLSHLDM